MSERNSKNLREEPAGARSPVRGSNHPARGRAYPSDGTITATIVVLGATGPVGRGVVGAAVAADRRVVAVGADRAELAALRVLHPDADLAIRTTSIATDVDARQLAASLRREERPIAGVIDAIPASPGRGRLIDQPTDVLRATLEADLLPHLSAARHLIPLLAETKRGGTYVLIGGPGSEAAWLNYGCRSVAAAALRMLSNVLHDEAQSLDVRVQMLSIGAPVRGESQCAHQCPEWPSGLEIGRRALQLIDRNRSDESAGPVVHFARSGAHAIGRVESASARTTTKRTGFRDVRAFLKTLTSDDRKEVFPDDTP